MKSGLATIPAISIMAARINMQIRNIFPAFSFCPRNSPAATMPRTTTPNTQRAIELIVRAGRTRKTTKVVTTAIMMKYPSILENHLSFIQNNCK